MTLKLSSRLGAIAGQVGTAMAEAIRTEPETWTQAWNAAGAATPHNPVSGMVYSGVSRWVLAGMSSRIGAATSAWAAQDEWLQVGCPVPKGEYGVQVIQFDGSSSRGQMRAYTVFHEAQVEGDPPRDRRFLRHPDQPPIDHRRSDIMFGTLAAAAETGDGCYHPDEDVLRLPDPQDLPHAGGYVSALAHNYIHWTAHPSRIGRTIHPGVAGAAIEELTAELGALLVANSLGVDHLPSAAARNSHRTWIETLGGPSGAATINNVSAAAARAAARVVGGINKGVSDPSVATLLAAPPPGGDGDRAETDMTEPERLRAARWMLKRALDGDPSADRQTTAVLIADMFDVPAAQLAGRRQPTPAPSPSR